MDAPRMIRHDGREENSPSPATMAVRPTPVSRQVTMGDNTLARFDKDLNPTIKITVKDGVIFTLLVKPLREHSAYFDNYLSDLWKDPSKGHATLQDHDADNFELFADWIQFGEIFVKEGRSHESLSHSSLFKAFCLGHDLGAPKFRNYIIDTIIAKVTAGHAPEVNLANVAYEGTEPNSPLRRILVDVYACWGTPEFVQAEHELPAEFLVNLAHTLMQLRGGNLDFQHGPFHHKNGNCHYHHLTSGDLCKHCTAIKEEPNQNEYTATSQECDDNSDLFVTPKTTEQPADGTPNIDSGIFGMSGTAHADGGDASSATLQDPPTPSPMPRPFIPKPTLPLSAALRESPDPFHTRRPFIPAVLPPSRNPVVKREREHDSDDEVTTGQGRAKKRPAKTLRDRQRIAALKAAGAHESEAIDID